jgi:outer membrane protein OmpA-like peptidoglycan-associated protein
MDNTIDLTVQTILVNGVPTVATINTTGQIKVKAIIGPKDLVTVEMTDDSGVKSVAQVLLELEKYALANVNFANGSSKLTNSAKDIIKQSAMVIQKHGFTEIDLTGHTDIKGGAKFDNKKLSDNRAKAVDKYLEQQLKGTDINVTTSGNAFTNPVASSNSATGLALNRRVEIVVK